MAQLVFRVPPILERVQEISNRNYINVRRALPKPHIYQKEAARLCVCCCFGFKYFAILFCHWIKLSYPQW